MAFTSEVTAKLNLDKTGFEKAWTSTVATIGKAGSDINSRLEKAFSFKDVFKGMMQGIGIGSVEQITRTVTGYFQDQADSAKDAEARSRNAVDRQRQYALSVASVSDRYKILNKQVNDLNVDIEMQKKLIADLEANKLTFINDSSRQELKNAKKQLEDFQDKQTTILEQIDHEAAARRKAWGQTLRETDAEKELSDAKISGAGELQTIQLKLNQLEKERIRLIQEGNSKSDAYRINYQKRVALENQQKEVMAAAQKQLPIAYVSIGREAVTRRPTTRPRGRTETERLADQGAAYEQRSREAIMKGDKIGAAQYAEYAAKSYSSAGKRIEQATSLIKKDTAESLGTELSKANTTLEAIKANLDPAKIQ